MNIIKKFLIVTGGIFGGFIALLVLAYLIFPADSATSLTFVNKSGLPVNMFVDGWRLGVVPPSGEKVLGYRKLNKNDNVTVRAYEFIVGDGNDFGWNDEMSGKSILGKTTDKLIFCKVFKSKVVTKDSTIVVEPSIQC